jgi:gluconate kinase
LGAQAGFDVAQALAVRELREGHAQILVEAGEALDLVFASVTCNVATKRMQGKMIHYLRKNQLACVHRCPHE